MATVSIEEAAELREKLRDCKRVVALVGAPNTGKSTLFSVLTGRSVTIANWPGVTVDIEIGRIRLDGGDICVVDLPGTYGLIPTSPEEAVTRRFLTLFRPDTILVLLDLSQPETSLSLVVQAIEAFPGRVLIAGTKGQLAHALGVHVDVERLHSIIRAPIIRTSALEGEGVDRLREALRSGERGGRVLVDYGILEPLIERLTSHPEMREASEKLGFSPRWIALELLSGHHIMYEELKALGLQELVKEAERLREEFIARHNIDPEHLIVERRVAYIERILRQVVVRRKPASSLWQRIADLHMHPILGPIVSMVGLLTTFMLVFSVNTGFPVNVILEALGHERAAELLSEYSISGLLATLFDRLAEGARNAIPGLLGELIGTGIIGGVGFVLSFTPLIAMVYLSLAILEDSGIAARMAVSFHSLFRAFGLSGRSVFPLVMGIGCNVPAVLATRALSEEERFRAAFAAPFIPCQARLAVIVAFTAAFIQGVLAQSLAVLLIYMLGLTAALLTSLIAARLVQPALYRRIGVEEYTPTVELIMEIPPVHRPHPKVVWWSVRDNTLHFLRKAGTIIFVLAIILWALFTFGPAGVAESVEDSYAYMLGEAASIVLEPFHIEEHTSRILGTALVSGLIAKEGVLSTIAIATGAEAEGAEALQALTLTLPQALGFLVFTSLYFPCIATLGALLGVTKSKKLVAAYAVYSILLALAFGIATYWAASLLAG